MVEYIQIYRQFNSFRSSGRSTEHYANKEMTRLTAEDLFVRSLLMESIFFVVDSINNRENFAWGKPEAYLDDANAEVHGLWSGLFQALQYRRATDLDTTSQYWKSNYSGIVNTLCVRRDAYDYAA